jgi:hypothetical protein
VLEGVSGLPQAARAAARASMARAEEVFITVCPSRNSGLPGLYGDSVTVP